MESIATLRLLQSALHNKKIELLRDLEDEEVLDVIRKEAKKRKEAIEAYEKGGREDLRKKEESELKILEKYLPAELSDEELKKIAREVVLEVGKNFGSVMGKIMGKVGGRADGGRVSNIVKEVIG